MAESDSFLTALTLFQTGDLPRADQLCRHLLAKEPNHDRAQFLLGLIAHRAGIHDEAARRISRAIQLNPGVAGYHANLSGVLLTLGRSDEAIASARQAVQLQPDYDLALANLGNSLLASESLIGAVEAYRRVPPSSAIAPLVRNNLGRALHMLGRLDDAAALLSEVARLNPNLAEVHANLGNVLKDQGRMDEAIAQYRQAVQAAPRNAAIGSTYLYALWFSPASTQREIFQEHLDWSRRHADPLRDQRPYLNDRNPDRRLRVGYVSPYFRRHTGGYLLEPILSHHDREQFEICCYSNTLKTDEVTQRLRRCAHVWRDAAMLSDEALAGQIREDHIDILVDVAAHMEGNRALVFARKPAPVQVNYLAYPATCGMSAMDCRITCPELDPPMTAQHDALTNSEQVIRISSTFWCYGPSPTSPPVNELPALSSGTFTFACLNNFSKVNDQVIELWSAVLSAVPNSQLLILIAGGAEGGRSIPPRFQRHGVPATRLRLLDVRPRDQYLALFNQADLSLDPFPYNGHTTSLDSLWMGVPFVTLAGNSPISRAGQCILGNVGLSELVVQDKMHYVELCTQLARDLPRLRELRRILRERMRTSPLMDAPSFTRNLEGAFRRMWHAWTGSAHIK